MTRVVNQGVNSDVPDNYGPAVARDPSEPLVDVIVAVTHATNPLPAGAPRSVYCTVAGNLICNFGRGGADVTIPMDAKTWHPICPSHIRATSTATVLLGY